LFDMAEVRIRQQLAEMARWRAQRDAGKLRTYCSAAGRSLWAT
jgi:hypothetical protein